MARLIEPHASFDYSAKIMLKAQRSWIFAAFGFKNGVDFPQKMSMENSMYFHIINHKIDPPTPVVYCQVKLEFLVLENANILLVFLIYFLTRLLDI